MSRQTLSGNRRRRKLFTYLWVAALAIGTIILISREMTALLYILATVGVTVLLVVVALSDLDRGENTTDNSNRIEDSAAIGSGITSTFGAKQS